MNAEHVDVATPHDYVTATERFLALVPRVEPMHPTSVADVERMMGRAGSLGVLVMASLDQGPIISLLGPPRRLAIYLVGSPFIGAKIFAERPDAGLYAPAHVTIYEHADGKAHIAYDRVLPEFDEVLSAISQALSSQCS
ncbi:MAG TPA: DUF302 domain-containing protein [Kofleriaceae bacterium]|jgi:hypothetical protein